MGKVLGIVSLVLGLVSLALGVITIAILTPFVFGFIALITSVSGIICGAIGIKKDDKAGLAIAGLIISSIIIVLWIFNMIIGGIWPWASREFLYS